ncbi:MAG: HD domain-containing protein [Treponema sp.]|nr:HD domain-containing protein [Treponema sp.]
MKNIYRTSFHEVEAHMRECMKDSAHDAEHVYRVLSYALDIARGENGARERTDTEILTTACLLHDIGRSAQFANPRVDHAAFGAQMARQWLLENGRDEGFAQAVAHCIEAHRYRSGNPPRTIEAKILFDADKIDVCGAVGIARTLLYKAQVSEPLYSLGENGEVLDGAQGEPPSFMQEYKFKLEGIYDKFYTKRGAELAAKRKTAAKSFYDSLLAETRECYSREKGGTQ